MKTPVTLLSLKTIKKYLNMKLNHLFPLLIITVLPTSARTATVTDIFQASRAIQTIKEKNYQGFKDISLTWPPLSPLESYTNSADKEEVEVFLEKVNGSLRDVTRDFLYMRDIEEKKRRMDLLVSAYENIENKEGYTNDLIKSALRRTIRIGIFSFLSEEKPDLEKAKIYFGKIESKNDEVFDFKKWMQNAKSYDGWAIDHQQYIDGLNSYPTIGKIILTLASSKEVVPRNMTHSDMLKKMSSFRLGVMLYESDFYEKCIIPFWINYIEKYGNGGIVSGAGTKGSMNDEELNNYNSIIKALPDHPYQGSPLTPYILNQRWNESTRIEGVNRVADEM